MTAVSILLNTIFVIFILPYQLDHSVGLLFGTILSIMDTGQIVRLLKETGLLYNIVL